MPPPKMKKKIVGTNAKVMLENARKKSTGYNLFCNCLNK